MKEHLIKLDKDQLKATIMAMEFALAKMHGNSKVSPTIYGNCNLVVSALNDIWEKHYPREDIGIITIR